VISLVRRASDVQTHPSVSHMYKTVGFWTVAGQSRVVLCAYAESPVGCLGHQDGGDRPWLLDRALDLEPNIEIADRTKVTFLC
jgi:hypothetical protein